MKPVGDLPVTGADQIEISDPAGKDIAGSRSRQTSLSDDKVVSVTRRNKCVKRVQKCAIVHRKRICRYPDIHGIVFFPVKTIARLLIFCPARCIWRLHQINSPQLLYAERTMARGSYNEIEWCDSRYDRSREKCTFVINIIFLNN